LLESAKTALKLRHNLTDWGLKMSKKPEAIQFADDRQSALDDDLYQWALDAEQMIRGMQPRIAELERFKAAYEEWHEKTEWVKETATYKELGKHRADVLRERIAKLEKDLVKESARTAEQKLRADQLDKQHSMQAKMHAEAASKVAELEKDAARYRSSIKEVLDLQLSSYGDGIGTHIELAAWVKKYTAMQKD
jgi:predicted RNase H-like nuclease (RuvC/YqgF family)